MTSCHAVTVCLYNPHNGRQEKLFRLQKTVNGNKQFSSVTGNANSYFAWGRYDILAIYSTKICDIYFI